MNKKSKEILKEAGWYEGRNIDIDDIVKFCEEDSFFTYFIYMNIRINKV